MTCTLTASDRTIRTGGSGAVIAFTWNPARPYAAIVAATVMPVTASGRTTPSGWRKNTPSTTANTTTASGISQRVSRAMNSLTSFFCTAMPVRCIETPSSVTSAAMARSERISAPRYSWSSVRSSISTRIPAVSRSGEMNRPVRSGLRSSAARVPATSNGGTSRGAGSAPASPATICCALVRL